MEVEKALSAGEDMPEGVGERLIISCGRGDGDGLGEGAVKETEKAWGWVAGIGVGTPRTLASFASLCGDRGVLGGAHVGWGEVGERCEEVSVSVRFVLGIMVVENDNGEFI